MNRLWIIALALTVEGLSIGFNPVSLAEEAPISVIAQTDPRLAESDRLQQQVIDLYQQGKYAEASRIAEQVLAIREAILGDHLTVIFRNNYEALQRQL